jgi:hypothetical protein
MLRIIMAVAALVVGFTAGFLTYPQSRRWCPECGVSLHCPQCAVSASTPRTMSR